MKERQQGVTTYPLVFLLVSSADHVSPVTGASPAVVLSKNGGAFAAAAGSVAEVGFGWYALTGAGLAADLGTPGPLVLHASAAGADPTDSLYTVVPWNPFDGLRMGLTALPGAAASAAGGLMGSTAPAFYAAPPTAAAVASQVDATLSANHGAGGWAAPADPWATDVAAGSYSGTQAGKLMSDWAKLALRSTVSDPAPTAATFRLASNASAVDGAYVGQTLTFLTGGLAGQRRTVSGYAGATRAVTCNPGFTAPPATADDCEVI